MRYPVLPGYLRTSEVEHGLSACTVDNPLAKARGLSLRTGAQTMLYLSHWGSRVVRWFWVNFQCRGVLLIFIVVGQGLTALTGGGCLDIFALVYLFSFLSPFSLGDGPISTKLLSQRAVKPKTTNQLILTYFL